MPSAQQEQLTNIKGNMTAYFSGGLDTPLSETKDWLRIHGKNGTHCPCCKQYVKIYRRPISSAMARWLIWLVRTWEHKSRGVEWIHARESAAAGGDYGKLRHWDLIEPRDKNKKTGFWRPTIKGIDFVHKHCRVPSHVVLYNDTFLEVDDERYINIVDCLKNKFSYDELMSAHVNVELPV